jgi:hypothetical protein
VRRRELEIDKGRGMEEESKYERKRELESEKVREEGIEREKVRGTEF